MPLTLAPADRKLLLIFGVVAAVLVVTVALLQPQQDRGSPVPSSYSADSGGAKAAYLLLQEAGYRVERWENPPRELPADAAGALLVLADPRGQADPDDKMALQRFLLQGGRVLATGMTAATLLPEANAEMSDPAKAGWGKYKPVVPSALTRAGEITMAPWAHWDSNNFAHVVHYARGDDPVVVSYNVGKGEVIWWAAPTPLTNAGIRESGDMELFLNSVGIPNQTHIFWDEYFHGSRPGPWSYVSDTPLRWALAQLAVLFLAVMITFSRRSGPVRPLVQASRLSPLEFVETLGSLYQSAHAAQVAVEVAYQRFQYLLGKRLGMVVHPSAAAMARAVGQRLRYERQDFAATLARCERAIGDPDLREKEAVELVQALNDFCRDLQLVPRSGQEKN